MGFLVSFSFIFLSRHALGESSSVRQYDQIIRKMAQKYDVDPDLIHSIIRAESNYDSQAVSPKGAVGLMQLMPETAKEYGVIDRYDPVENIEGGVKFLKDLLQTYDQKDDLVLAAYNAGPEAVKKHKGVPPFPETVQYIQRVKSYWNPEQSSNKNTKIFSYRDNSGRLVITNDRNYYLRTKK
ncbi:MAG: lytic transglycosylase domain-containing protein [Candidatus Aminicenantes bacterium]|nr:lytic transglycosylase domain-containing protein [Candidatus Aminicenantes bacterium]